MPYCSILECKNDSRKKNLINGGVSYHRIKSGRINALKQKYDAILEEDKKRKERNEYILKKLDKMRTCTAVVPVRQNLKYNDHRQQLYSNTTDSMIVSAPLDMSLQKRFYHLDIPEKHCEETKLLGEISKKYILIPKLGQRYDRDHIPEIIPKVDESNDWKSKYDILKQLKTQEKEDLEPTRDSTVDDKIGQTNVSNDLIPQKDTNKPLTKYKYDLPEYVTTDLVSTYDEVNEESIVDMPTANQTDNYKPKIDNNNENIHLQNVDNTPHVYAQQEFSDVDSNVNDMEQSKNTSYLAADNNYISKPITSSPKISDSNENKPENNYIENEYTNISQGNEYANITQGDEFTNVYQGNEYANMNQEQEYSNINEENVYTNVNQGNEYTHVNQENEYTNNHQENEFTNNEQGKEYTNIVQGNEYTHINQENESTNIEQGNEYTNIVQANENTHVNQENEYTNINQGNGYTNIDPEKDIQVLSPNDLVQIINKETVSLKNEGDGDIVQSISNVDTKDINKQEVQLENEVNYVTPDIDSDYNAVVQETDGNDFIDPIVVTENSDLINSTNLEAFTGDPNQYYNQPSNENYAYEQQGAQQDYVEYPANAEGQQENYAAYYEGAQADPSYIPEAVSDQETLQRYDQTYEQQYNTAYDQENYQQQAYDQQYPNNEYIDQQGTEGQDQNQQEAVYYENQDTTLQYDEQQHNNEITPQYVEQQLDNEEGYEHTPNDKIEVNTTEVIPEKQKAVLDDKVEQVTAQ